GLLIVASLRLISIQIFLWCEKDVFHFDAVTRQIIPALSSVTSNEPSLNTAVHTGLPYTRLLPASAMKPVRKSSGGPEGFPSLYGTNTTRYPDSSERFHEPCCPTNAPFLYFAGNWLCV